MSTKNKLFFGAAIASLALVSACTHSMMGESSMASGASMAAAAPMAAPAPMAMEKTVQVGGAPMYPSKNIVQNAVNSKDHTTLVAAVKAAGLVDTLQTPVHSLSSRP